MASVTQCCFILFDCQPSNPHRYDLCCRRFEMLNVKCEQRQEILFFFHTNIDTALFCPWWKNCSHFYKHIVFYEQNLTHLTTSKQLLCSGLFVKSGLCVTENKATKVPPHYEIWISVFGNLLLFFLFYYEEAVAVCFDLYLTLNVSVLKHIHPQKKQTNYTILLCPLSLNKDVFCCSAPRTQVLKLCCC